MTNREGQQIDNYRLIRLLGAGQFGEVYLAEHISPQTQAPVAIKVLEPLAWNAQRDLLNFLKEVRASSFKHPHIVQIYDFGVERDIPFIVMEYAPNGTLRQRHPTGTLVPLPTIVSYVQQAASALQYIHDKRLVHRDIKPANMLIGERGQVLLSDFGITTTSHRTSSQGQEEMAGTILYIAPEQIKGQPRPASDQYSLSMVVYEWLCGNCPFQGPIFEVMYKHEMMPPPLLSAKIPTISPDVEQVVMRALAKDPKQRFDSILAFARALEQASLSVSKQTTVPISSPSQSSDDTLVPGQFQSSGSTVVSGPSLPPDSLSVEGSAQSTKPRISRRIIVLGCVIAGSVLATGGLAWWYAGTLTPPSHPHQAPSPTPRPTPIPQGQVLSIYHGHSRWVNTATWSLDGKLIASGSDDTTVQIWNVVDGRHVLTYSGHTDLVEAVVWSPNGQHIASGSFDGTVRVWNAADGSHVFTYKGHTNHVDTVAWSPDGQRIASGSYDRTVQVWNATDGSHVITYNGHTDAVHMVAWSPDGQQIASGSFDGTVQVWNATNGGRVFTYKGHTGIVQAVSWSPKGKYIASGGNDKTVQVWDATGGDGAGSYGHLVITYKGHSDVVNTVAWSPDGQHIASGGVDNTVQIWDALNGAHPFTYRGHTFEVRVVAWSPDGRLLASGGDDDKVQVWGTGY